MTNDLKDVERALDDLLTAIVTEDSKPVEPSPVRVGRALDPTARPLSRAESDLRALLREPVRTACKLAVRRLGERLFEILGSTNAMARCAERVAARDEADYQYRYDILDSAWDGIGAGNDRWSL